MPQVLDHRLASPFATMRSYFTGTWAQNSSASGSHRWWRTRAPSCRHTDTCSHTPTCPSAACGPQAERRRWRNVHQVRAHTLPALTGGRTGRSHRWLTNGSRRHRRLRPPVPANGDAGTVDPASLDSPAAVPPLHHLCCSTTREYCSAAWHDVERCRLQGSCSRWHTRSKSSALAASPASPPISQEEHLPERCSSISAARL
jgi:hypothetical protein